MTANDSTPATGQERDEQRANDRIGGEGQVVREPANGEASVAATGRFVDDGLGTVTVGVYIETGEARCVLSPGDAEQYAAQVAAAASVARYGPHGGDGWIDFGRTAANGGAVGVTGPTADGCVDEQQTAEATAEVAGSDDAIHLTVDLAGADDAVSGRAALDLDVEQARSLALDLLAAAHDRDQRGSK